METLIDNPAFHTYAVCASILAFKMILSGFYTAAMRFRSTGYANAEDALAFGGASTGAPGVDTPQVAHALRIQRNDGENILPFFAIGLLYVISGASASRPVSISGPTLPHEYRTPPCTCFTSSPGGRSASSSAYCACLA